MARCAWAETHPILQKYHDEHWGVPVHDDKMLFMYLVMECMSCGLSWLLMLKKQETFRHCFANFDFKQVARFTAADVQHILNTESMLKSQRKIEAMITNAQAFLRVIEEFGSFNEYIWKFSKGKTMVYPSHQKRLCTRNALSDKVAKDMKKRGFKYVGSVIIYSYLQGIGIINDHLSYCDCYNRK